MKTDLVVIDEESNYLIFILYLYNNILKTTLLLK